MNADKAEVVVIKLNTQAEEVWRYTGQVLERGKHSILLEAAFNRDDLPFEEIVLKRGDRFLEIFFDNRWYNVFAIFDKEDGTLKAWYCNISRPAKLAQDEIHYVDLALDLLVYPDGRRKTLDFDEFDALEIDPDERHHAWHALEELQELFKVLPAGPMPESLLGEGGKGRGGGKFPTTS